MYPKKTAEVQKNLTSTAKVSANILGVGYEI